MKHTARGPRSLGSGWAGAAALHARSLDPHWNRKLDVIITLSTSSVCWYISRHRVVFQTADDAQRNASRAQPYSGAKPSSAVVRPWKAKCKRRIQRSTREFSLVASVFGKGTDQLRCVEVVDSSPPPLTTTTYLNPPFGLTPSGVWL